MCPSCGKPLELLVNGTCPECRMTVELETRRRRRRLPSFLSVPEMRYQNAYVWLVLVSALDIILTLLVLYVWEGEEANPLTDMIIRDMGFGWAILFKFGMMLFAIIACEVIGRRNDRAGRRLARLAVAINSIPVIFTFALLHFSGPPIQPPHSALALLSFR